MAKLENIYIVFFKGGSKERIENPSDEDLAILRSRDVVDFVTHVGSDYPCDYDWDTELGKWQSKIF